MNINLRSVSAIIRTTKVPRAQMVKNGRIKGLRDLAVSGYEVTGFDGIGLTGTYRAALVNYRLRAGSYGVRPEAVDKAREHMDAIRAALEAKGYAVEPFSAFEFVVRPV